MSWSQRGRASPCGIVSALLHLSWHLLLSPTPDRTHTQTNTSHPQTSKRNRHAPLATVCSHELCRLCAPARLEFCRFAETTSQANRPLRARSLLLTRALLRRSRPSLSVRSDLLRVSLACSARRAAHSDASTPGRCLPRAPSLSAHAPPSSPRARASGVVLWGSDACSPPRACATSRGLAL